MPDLTLIAQTVAALAGKIPAFERPTEYIALVQPNVYTFYHGKIGSTDVAERLDVSEFEQVANEYVVPQSTAKWAKWHRDSYAVGAAGAVQAELGLPAPAGQADRRRCWA